MGDQIKRTTKTHTDNLICFFLFSSFGFGELLLYSIYHRYKCIYLTEIRVLSKCFSERKGKKIQIRKKKRKEKKNIKHEKTVKFFSIQVFDRLWQRYGVRLFFFCLNGGHIMYTYVVNTYVRALTKHLSLCLNNLRSSSGKKKDSKREEVGKRKRTRE